MAAVQEKLLSASSSEDLLDVEDLLKSAVQIGHELELADSGLLVSCNR